MTTGTVFLNNRTQAVRLPKAVAFPGDVTRVEVRVVGDTRVLVPLPATWHDWSSHRQARDREFMTDRAQGQYDARAWDD